MQSYPSYQMTFLEFIAHQWIFRDTMNLWFPGSSYVP